MTLGVLYRSGDGQHRRKPYDAGCSVSLLRRQTAQKEAKAPILREIGTPRLQGGSVEEAKGNTWSPAPF